MLACSMRAIWLALLLAGCDRPPPEPVRPTSWDLLSPGHAAGWRSAGIPDQGEARVRDGEIHLAAGLPMTGIAFAGWEAAGLPGTGYAVEYEAMRVEGEDIFGMLTFPVASHAAHATFVLGGWGGTLTGISSIDFADASENSTRGEQRFANGRWYRVRLEVRPEDLRAWVEGRLVVNASIKGRKVSLRPGFIDHCLPFGFATWNTAARIRAVKVEKL